MCGVMPKTELLVIRNSMILFTLENYAQVAFALGVTISDGGAISFMGEVRNPSYSLEYSPYTAKDGWTKQAAIEDWAKYHMAANLPREISIRRVLC